MNAKVLKTIDLALNNCLGQTELRNAVDKNAAAGEKCLKDSYLKAIACKLACAGNARGARANNGNLLAVARGNLRLRTKLRLVAYEALQLTNGNRIALLAQNALAFALVLLWANAATDGRQHGILADNIQCTTELFSANGLNELRNLNVYGAARYAERLLAVEAAIGLSKCHLLSEALINRTEIACALSGRLFVVGRAGCLCVGNVLTFTCGMRRSPPRKPS